MLRVLKKYYKMKKLFYGINCGTIGFLMNKFNRSNLEKIIKKTKMFSINPLEINIINSNGKKFRTLAVNEISLLRQSRQTAILNLRINNTELIKKLIGDGALVSTLQAVLLIIFPYTDPLSLWIQKNYSLHLSVHFDLEDGKVRCFQIAQESLLKI